MERLLNKKETGTASCENSLPLQMATDAKIGNGFWAKIKFGALPGKQSKHETKYVAIKSFVKTSER